MPLVPHVGVTVEIVISFLVYGVTTVLPGRLHHPPVITHGDVIVEVGRSKNISSPGRRSRGKGHDSECVQSKPWLGCRCSIEASLRNQKRYEILTSARNTLESHLICFAAEQARISNKVVDMEEFRRAAREEAAVLKKEIQVP